MKTMYYGQKLRNKQTMSWCFVLINCYFQNSNPPALPNPSLCLSRYEKYMLNGAPFLGSRRRGAEVNSWERARCWDWQSHSWGKGRHNTMDNFFTSLILAVWLASRCKYLTVIVSFYWPWNKKINYLSWNMTFEAQPGWQPGENEVLKLSRNLRNGLKIIFIW